MSERVGVGGDIELANGEPLIEPVKTCFSQCAVAREGVMPAGHPIHPAGRHACP